jgi:tRNA (cytosine38-C5)-methyltransferase
LKKSGASATVTRAFDWDQNACKVYTSNYGEDIVRKVSCKIIRVSNYLYALNIHDSSKADILTLDSSTLGKLGSDIWLMSPSCQPYTTLNPNAKGAEDPRAKSFMHIIQEVLPQLVSQNQHPRYLFVENVAGFEVRYLAIKREINSLIQTHQ